MQETWDLKPYGTSYGFYNCLKVIFSWSPWCISKNPSWFQAKLGMKVLSHGETTQMQETWDLKPSGTSYGFYNWL